MVDATFYLGDGPVEPDDCIVCGNSAELYVKMVTTKDMGFEFPVCYPHSYDFVPSEREVKPPNHITDWNRLKK